MLRTILAIDDNEDIQVLLRHILGDKYCLFVEASGEAGLQTALKEKPELVILDLGLPEMDGFELCNRFRSLPDLENVPIIILSASKGAEVHAKAYKLGADNYLEKPFEKEELLAIVESKLRYTSNPRKTIGSLTVDMKAGSVYHEGLKLDLTPKEFKILGILWESNGDVVSRDAILKRVWENTHVSDRVIDNHITALRKKVAPAGVKIESVYSEGYRIVVN